MRRKLESEDTTMVMLHFLQLVALKFFSFIFNFLIMRLITIEDMLKILLLPPQHLCHL